jgi:hypothetical protein
VDRMLDNRQRNHRAGRIAPASAAIFAMLHLESSLRPVRFHSYWSNPSWTS